MEKFPGKTEQNENEEIDNILRGLAKQDRSLGDYLEELQKEDPDKYNKVIERLNKMEENKIFEGNIDKGLEGFPKVEKEKKPKNKKEIIVDTDSEEYIRERDNIADIYGFMDPTKLVKKGDGKWYFNDIEISDYIRLHSGRDVDDIYKR
jgi:hypothetical protein